MCHIQSPGVKRWHTACTKDDMTVFSLTFTGSSAWDIFTEKFYEMVPLAARNVQGKPKIVRHYVFKTNLVENLKTRDIISGYN